MLNKRQVVYIPTLWFKAAHKAAMSVTRARKEVSA